MRPSASYEDAKHLIIQCPYLAEVRYNVYDWLGSLDPNLDKLCTFDVLMGNAIDGWEFVEMIPIWQLTCSYIVRMYFNVFNYRKSLG